MYVLKCGGRSASFRRERQSLIPRAKGALRSQAMDCVTRRELRSLQLPSTEYKFQFRVLQDRVAGGQRQLPTGKVMPDC
jgi:hypothetical protein